MPPSFPTRRSADLRYAASARYPRSSNLLIRNSILGGRHPANVGVNAAKAAFSASLPRSVWNSAAVSPGVAVTTQAPRSEEHTSELQSLMRISYAVFCLKKKKKNKRKTHLRIKTKKNNQCIKETETSKMQ